MQDRTRMFALILLGLASLLAPARAQDEQPEAKPTKKAEAIPRFAKLAEAGDIPALAWVLDNYYLSSLPSEQMEALKVRTLKKLTAHPESEEAAEAVANALMYSSPLPVPETIAILDKMIATVKHADALSALHFSLAQVLMHQPDEASKKRAIEVLRTLDSKYRDSFYGRFAKGLIFETQNLQVGMLAPEFAGDDVHGNPIKLSDYRGKVTFLVFWGFW